MRYTVDFKDCDSKHCNIVDLFTGKVLHKNVPEDGADGTLDRLNSSYDDAAKLADQISRFVNGMGGRSVDDFVAAMSREHRTLAQNFTRLCVGWIERLASLTNEPGDYDMRNAASVMLARQIVASPGWEKAKYLPYI